MLAAALASTQQPVEEDEFEVDEDMLREAEQAMPRSTAPSRDEFDDDEAMLREMEGEFSAPPVVPAKKRLELEEDGFDDAAMLEELERVEAKSSSRAPTSEAPIDEDLAGFFDEQMDEDIYA